MANENGNPKVTRTVFDLDSFEDVTLVKEYVPPTAASVHEALAHLGNNEARLLSIINIGLKEQAASEARKSTDGWLQETEEGEIVPFSGVQADSKKVNALVLTLAKTVFGFGKDMTKEQKRGAKESAAEMIRTTPAIKEGLRKSAAVSEE